ncbi:Hint domain-containing protein [Gemmobacter serpentinus]|uniref:Hint domain-containing protein n=1 Tax=Gemmobacter serpentinus TaxID=2652247 RepID=UPI00124D46B8|nr:Hint domain-containing protein [Gemmobacter serpentinus]
MPETSLTILPRSGVTITRADGSATGQSDILSNALNGNAFSWEVPHDLALTFGSSASTLHFDDADGWLSDDPVNGASVLDQRLTQPVTIDGQTYVPNETELRWQSPPPVYVENEFSVTLFDAAGNMFHMVGVSITTGYSTQVVGIFFDGPPPPDGSTLYYRQGQSQYFGTGQKVPIPVNTVPCFHAGSLIATPSGPRLIEELQAGDRVLTLDHGAQVIRWIGRSRVCGLGPLAPVHIAPGALGNDRALLVSPNHRILLTSARAELLFGQPEVLVAARFLIDGKAVRQVPCLQADYLHLMFDRHELVSSAGIWSESLMTGPMALQSLDFAARAELQAIFPDPTEAAHSARASLTRGEAALLRMGARE